MRPIKLQFDTSMHVITRLFLHVELETHKCACPQATHTYEFLIIKKWIFHLALITYELDESK